MKTHIFKFLIITLGYYLISNISLVLASDSILGSSKYSVEQISFNSNELKLEGTLFLPRNKNKVAGIVIVCGSGPIDRDGKVTTVQTNNQLLFYKLWADYLSSHNIATFRFDKRYITHKPLNPLEITQGDQINDIVSAAKYLQSRDEIDINKIYILGHSEGGSIVPVAARQLPNIAGVIIMASPSIPINQLFITQLKAQRSPYVEATEKAFTLLKEKKFPEGGQIWGVGEVYWREWIEYTENANKIVLELNKPTLILQGLADENYPQKTLSQNVSNWENLALKSKKISFIKYPNTTHRFLIKNTVSISESVFVDIIHWIDSM